MRLKTRMGSNIFDDLNEKTEILQELMTECAMRHQSKVVMIEFLVFKHNTIVIRMDANKNHQRPHIHVDFGSNHHGASYAIDTGKCIDGNEDIYSKEIQRWIAENRDLLIKVWDITRTSPQPEEIVAQLKASKSWF